jgi:hypothetical protein
LDKKLPKLIHNSTLKAIFLKDETSKIMNRLSSTTKESSVIKINYEKLFFC